MSTEPHRRRHLRATTDGETPMVRTYEFHPARIVTFYGPTEAQLLRQAAAWLDTQGRDATVIGLNIRTTPEGIDGPGDWEWALEMTVDEGAMQQHQPHRTVIADD